MIQELQKWYESNCNGEWEHSFGIEITTLDNPGWYVVIDLQGTRLENKELNRVKEISGTDWIQCKIDNKRYVGAGGPLNLAEILETFKDLLSSIHPTEQPLSHD